VPLLIRLLGPGPQMGEHDEQGKGEQQMPAARLGIGQGGVHLPQAVQQKWVQRWIAENRMISCFHCLINDSDKKTPPSKELVGRLFAPGLNVQGTLLQGRSAKDAFDQRSEQLSVRIPQLNGCKLEISPKKRAHRPERGGGAVQRDVKSLFHVGQNQLGEGRLGEQQAEHIDAMHSAKQQRGNANNF
jgi:hypothetical protein